MDGDEKQPFTFGSTDAMERQPFTFGSTDAMEEPPPPKKRSKLSTNRSGWYSEADRAESKKRSERQQRKQDLWTKERKANCEQRRKAAHLTSVVETGGAAALGGRELADMTNGQSKDGSVLANAKKRKPNAPLSDSDSDGSNAMMASSSRLRSNAKKRKPNAASGGGKDGSNAMMASSSRLRSNAKKRKPNAPLSDSDSDGSNAMMAYGKSSKRLRRTRVDEDGNCADKRKDTYKHPNSKISKNNKVRKDKGRQIMQLMRDKAVRRLGGAGFRRDRGGNVMYFKNFDKIARSISHPTKPAPALLYEEKTYTVKNENCIGGTTTRTIFPWKQLQDEMCRCKDETGKVTCNIVGRKSRVEKYSPEWVFEFTHTNLVDGDEGEELAGNITMAKRKKLSDAA